MPELVADVLALAKAAGAARFHLVGHDWGGAVAWALAGRHPERVATLTSVSTPHPRAFAAALLTGGQLPRSAYIGFFRIPRLPELVLGAGGLRGLRFLLARSGLGPAWAERYARALAEPGALAAALAWYRAAVPFGMAVPRVPVRPGMCGGRATRRWGGGPRPVPGAGSPGPTASSSWKGSATGCPSITPRSWPSCSWSTWRLPAPAPSPAGDPGRAALLAAGVARAAEPVEAADGHDVLAGGPGVEAQGLGGRRVQRAADGQQPDRPGPAQRPGQPQLVDQLAGRRGRRQVGQSPADPGRQRQGRSPLRQPTVRSRLSDSGGAVGGTALTGDGAVGWPQGDGQPGDGADQV
jgi:hypothetical protein